MSDPWDDVAMTSVLYEKPIFRVAGDRGVLVEYGDGIDPELNRKVRAMAIATDQASPKGLLEVIPTYRSIILIYDPSSTSPHQLESVLLSLEAHLSAIDIPLPKTVKIPVCYGGEFGPDIEFVARSNNLTEADVIRMHSNPDYQIYMVGFTPGFPYLGGLPEALHTPRLETPRTLVPAGSVGIANAQTGVYSIDSPGGWQLIGRTPLKLFDPTRTNPFLFTAGDLLKFEPISLDEYYDLEKAGET
jgi:KipI family sensor histidine kinase inhibitor